jgi:hypothetical protein
LWQLYETNAIWHWVIVVVAMLLLVFVLLTGTASVPAVSCRWPQTE